MTTSESASAPSGSAALTTVKEIAGLAGLVSVLLYGFGWLFASRFYGEFGVQPEEAGVTAEWLIPRIVTAALPTTLVILVGYRVTELGRARSTRRAVIYAATFMCGVGALWVRFLAEKDDSFYSVPSILGLAVVEVGGALLAVSWTWVGKIRGLRAVCCAVIAVTTAVLPVRLAADLSDSVRESNAITWRFFPGVPIVNAPPVTVLKRDASLLEPEVGPCAILLGSTSGTYILSVPMADESTVVWRVPANTVALREECPE
jgi:hypothetical protein